jgi:hypothetical protein
MNFHFEFLNLEVKIRLMQLRMLTTILKCQTIHAFIIVYSFHYALVPFLVPINSFSPIYDHEIPMVYFVELISHHDLNLGLLLP